MGFSTFALIAAALTLAAPLIAATPSDTAIQPAVQPGGDIPPHFRPFVAPIPKGGDIPPRFAPPRAEFQYVRREATIPMRDGVKLYAVLIIPKGTSAAAGRFPIMLDRTPYSADKRPSAAPSAPGPRISCRRSTPSWSARATSSRSRTSAANTNPKAITS